MSLASVAVVEAEGFAQLLVVVWHAEAAVGVAVPEDAVVAVGDDEGHADLGVVLEEVFVLAFHVEFF